MALNVTSLTDYVNVHKDELLVKATADAKTLRYIDIMPNVKWKEAIPYLESQVVLQDGSVCRLTTGGSDNFSERFIETKAVAVFKDFCWKDFEKKAQNYQLLWEAGRETLPFEQKIQESNVAAIQSKVEDLVWQGDDGLGINGIIDVAATEGTSALTATSVSDTIENVLAAMPNSAYKKGINVFMSYTDFRKYIKELNGTCCANRPIQDGAVEDLVYPYDSRVTIVPVDGLEGTNHIVAASKDAIVYGTDIEGSEGAFKFWFEDKEDLFYLKVLFRIGIALRWPDEVAIA